MRKLIFTTIITFALINLNAQESENPKEINTNGEKGVFVSANELKWFSPFEGAPVEFATVSGNTFKTSHVTFGRFPGEFGPGLHTHSNSYEGIVISGIIENPMASENEKPKRMGAGSYWYVPANSKHDTKCVSKEPCVFMMFQSVPFDFAPAEK